MSDPRVEFGEVGGAFDGLADGEWAFFFPQVVEAGAEFEVVAHFNQRETKRLPMLDMRRRVVGAVTVTAGPDCQVGANGAVSGPAQRCEMPRHARSGCYFIDNKFAALVARSGDRGNITVALPYETAHCFNGFGGGSVYTEPRKDDNTVSTFRPLPRENMIDRAEGFIRWASDLPYPVNYASDATLAAGSADNAALLIIAGRSEYWSPEARERVRQRLDAGGHVLLLSSETMFYEIEHAADGRSFRFLRPSSEALYAPDRVADIRGLIGPNPFDGGFLPGGDLNDQGHGTYTVETASLLLGGRLARGDRLRLSSVAYDGLPLAGYRDGRPILNDLPFHRSELVAWNFGPHSPQKRIGAFLVSQRSPTSGVCVHMGSFSWSMHTGLGGTGPQSADAVAVVTATIDALLHGKPVFTRTDPQGPS